jgi:hypothetical protein
MSRRSAVQVTYQPCPGEAFVVEVVAADGYPDALDEARSQAVRGITELIYAALAAYPDREPVADDD